MNEEELEGYDLGEVEEKPAAYRVIAHSLGESGEELCASTISEYPDPQSAIDEAETLMRSLGESFKAIGPNCRYVRICVETVVEADGEEFYCGALFDECAELKKQ